MRRRVMWVLAIAVVSLATTSGMAQDAKRQPGPPTVITIHVLNSKTGRPLNARFLKIECYTVFAKDEYCPNVRYLQSAAELRNGLLRVEVPGDADIDAKSGKYHAFCSCLSGAVSAPFTEVSVPVERVMREGLVFNQRCEEGMPPGAAGMVPKPGEITVFYRHLSWGERVWDYLL